MPHGCKSSKMLRCVASVRSVFLVHEEMDACDEAQSLGFYINGREGYVAPVPDRLQRVILCFRWLSRRPSVSSKAVQRLVGHAVHFMLLNRGLLSTMRGLYDFIQRSGEGRKRLWKNAAREAAWISELLRVCIADLTKPWSQKISASDASLSGIAVCTRSCSEAEARDIGRVKESWRFKGRNPADRPRQILDEPGDPFSDVATVRPLPFVHEDPFELNLEFPEISQDFMAQSEWHLAFNQHMRFPEHITLLEGRGIVASLRHKARCIEAFGKKHLHINDNLGMVLAADKGRSSSMGILQVCRRLACLQIALGAQLVCRWVPSEWNVADKGSRRWEHLRRGHASSPTSRISAFKESEDSPQCSRSAKSSSSEAHRCQSSSSGARFETQEPSPGSEPAGGTNQAGESSEAGSTSTELCSLCSVSRQTLLERAAVSHPVAQDYLQRAEDFRSFARSHKMSLKNMTKFDESLCEYLNHLFQEGCDLSEGTKSYAAVMDAFPAFSQKGTLTRSKRALQGWHKLDPGRTRPPVPWPLIALLALRMAEKGLLASAAAVLIMFVAYLRPGEALGLRVEDLVMPSPLHSRHTLNLHPQERQESSKMGVSDESIILDSTVIPNLGQLLEMFLCSHGQKPLLGLEYSELRGHWESALSLVGLPRNHAVLYQLRHSGPSHDRLHKLRSLSEVKKRGRWVSDSSVKRYEAHAKLNQEFHRLPKKVQKMSMEASCNFSTKVLKCFIRHRRKIKRSG